MIRSVTVSTIPHNKQRYATTGDWIYNKAGGLLTVYVSDMGDWRFNLLVGIHELVEAVLCVRDGVEQKEIDAFDQVYEELRARKLDGDSGQHPWAELQPLFDRITADSEPGDDPEAPYHRQHCIATAVERMLCPFLGVSWYEYEAANLALYAHEER
jgi:hypothetical protein